MFKPRFHVNKNCRKMNCLSAPLPKMIGSRGTQNKFVSHIVESLCAKFGAFFQSVTIFSPKPPHYTHRSFSHGELSPHTFFLMVNSHPIALSHSEL